MSLPALAVAIASFNRRQTTLRCLEALLAQRGDFTLEIHLFDDASSDGTAAAVQAEFPDVRIVHGDGMQFWGGGMRSAIRSATSVPYDYLLWLNDDVVLVDGAISAVINAHAKAHAEYGPGPHLIVAPLVGSAGEVSYSGLRKRNQYHPAQIDPVLPVRGRLVPCDAMNGNCVLIPRAAFELCGSIEPGMPHQLGDIDYGYRARQLGCSIWVAPEAAGTCPRNEAEKRWLQPGLPLLDRIRILFSPLGLPPGPWLRFMWRHAGVLGVLELTFTYVKALTIAVLPAERGNPASLLRAGPRRGN